MNVPLYTGGSIQNRIKETLVLEERSRKDLEAARRGVDADDAPGVLRRCSRARRR